MNDFRNELPGYLNNGNINGALNALNLKPGTANIFQNMRLCYERLIEMGLVEAKELALLESWFSDIRDLEFDEFYP